MDIRRTAKKLAAGLHREYWLLRLRLAERSQEKHLAHTAAVIRRMCGHAAGPHLEKLYARRVHVRAIIREVIRPNKSREDLTDLEIQLVMLEFLRRRFVDNSDALPA